MRRKLKPVMFDDEDAEGAEAGPAVVRRGPGEEIDERRARARSRRTPDGEPVHVFRTLIGDLATITRSTAVPRLPGAEPLQVATRPTPLRMKVPDHLGVAWCAPGSGTFD